MFDFWIFPEKCRYHYVQNISPKYFWGNFNKPPVIDVQPHLNHALLELLKPFEWPMIKGFEVFQRSPLINFVVAITVKKTCFWTRFRMDIWKLQINSLILKPTFYNVLQQLEEIPHYDLRIMVLHLYKVYVQSGRKECPFFFHERLQYLSNIKKRLFSQLQIATSLYLKDSAIFKLKITFSL